MWRAWHMIVRLLLIYPLITGCLMRLSYSDHRCRRIPCLEESAWAMLCLTIPVITGTEETIRISAHAGVLGLLLGGGLPMASCLLLKGRGLGGADLRILMLAGILLGYPDILNSLIISCISAMPEAIHCRGRKADRTFPMMPYICLGIWSVYTCRMVFDKGEILWGIM